MAFGGLEMGRLEAGGQVPVQPNSRTHREGWHRKRLFWGSLGTGALRGLELAACNEMSLAGLSLAYAVGSRQKVRQS